MTVMVVCRSDVAVWRGCHAGMLSTPSAWGPLRRSRRQEGGGASVLRAGSRTANASWHLSEVSWDPSLWLSPPGTRNLVLRLNHITPSCSFLSLIVYFIGLDVQICRTYAIEKLVNNSLSRERGSASRQDHVTLGANYR